MFIINGRQIPQKLRTISWRSFATVHKEPYWRSKFPNRVASFDEIPTVSEKYDTHKMPQVAESWFKEHGHVVKHPTPFGKYNVHLFHFEDFQTVYLNDGPFPIRQSHHAIAQYRNERKHLYDSVGLGPGEGEEWRSLRKIATSKMHLRPSNVMAEQVVDDLIKIINNNLNEKGEIDLLPWLNRWSFESIGVVALNRRLNALSEIGNERADKMVAAGARTDELIALTTMDPLTNYEERYKQLVEAQDFFYSVLRSYVDDIKRDIELEPESNGVAQIMLKDESCSEKHAITLILDIFQGSLQTVQLTALMALYNLACHKDIQNYARDEAMERMPSKDSKYFDVKGPKEYIASIVYETLRLNPPIIGNGRLIQKELILGGYTVPAYTNVILHFQVACRQEENYIDALQFIPGREDYRKINYIFGGSSRMCIGRSFALRQLLLILSKLVRNFEFSYDGGEVEMFTTLHNRPVKPLILKLKPTAD